MTDENVSLSLNELRAALETAYNRGWSSGRDAGKQQAAVEAERRRMGRIEAESLADEIISLVSRGKHKVAAAPTEEK